MLKPIAFALMPVVVLLFGGELFARGYYFYKQGRDLKYLTAPFGFPKGPFPLPYRPRRTHTRYDPCSRRQITFTVNSQGGRGPEWSLAKAQGALRILVVGESSTFGVNSPDDLTWPALFERELQDRYEVPVEVLNGGQSGGHLEEIVQLLSNRWFRYRPDVVIYYGAYNDTHGTAYGEARDGIYRFHRDSPLGRLSNALYYSSMLYTYGVEKFYFYQMTRTGTVPQAESFRRHVGRYIQPEVESFRRKVSRFIQLVRNHGATPLLALQVTEFPELPRVRRLALDLEGQDEIQRLLLEAVNTNAGTNYDRLAIVRSYQTQVLVEVARRTAEASKAEAIDPRPAFVRNDAQDPLFCDEIHLTDLGNRVLAGAIADRLDLTAVAPRRDATKESGKAVGGL